MTGTTQRRIARPDARTLITRVLDPGSWRSWDAPVVDRAAPGSEYAQDLAEARAKFRAMRYALEGDAADTGSGEPDGAATVI